MWFMRYPTPVEEGVRVQFGSHPDPLIRLAERNQMDPRHRMVQFLNTLGPLGSWATTSNRFLQANAPERAQLYPGAETIEVGAADRVSLQFRHWIQDQNNRFVQRPLQRLFDEDLDQDGMSALGGGQMSSLFPSPFGEFDVQVIRAIDGDSVLVYIPELDRTEEVRLSGLNAAEMGKVGGQEAKNYLEQVLGIGVQTHPITVKADDGPAW